MLGGRPGRRLPIISIGGYYREGKTLADIGREMELYREAGMAGCKFKVGGLTPEADAERVAGRARRRGARLRPRGGRQPRLARSRTRCASRAWSSRSTSRWFEEPCHWHDDARMMAEVRRATRIPVTAGQSEITSHAVRRLARRGRGGLGELRRLRGRRRHRVAARRGPVRGRGREDGAPRGAADRAASSWPRCRTAPTSSASPIRSATPSGRPSGPTAPRSRTASSRFPTAPASASSSTRP